MPHKPRISVVIPAYNRADLVDRAVRSVLHRRSEWALDLEQPARSGG
jgi:hypothetical protein